MKKCPRELCTRSGVRRFKGYCSKTHYKLDHQKPKKIIVFCKNCNKALKRNPSQLAPSGNAYCSQCKKARGEHHPRWKEGQYITDAGYRMVKTNGYYQREHRLVWQEVNRASLLPWADGTIHHIDFDKLNNSPDNLLLLSATEHSQFHRYLQLGQKMKALNLLQHAACRQYFYPKEVDRFIMHILIEESA